MAVEARHFPGGGRTSSRRTAAAAATACAGATARSSGSFGGKSGDFEVQLPAEAEIGTEADETSEGATEQSIDVFGIVEAFMAEESNEEADTDPPSHARYVRTSGKRDATDSDATEVFRPFEH